MKKNYFVFTIIAVMLLVVLMTGFLSSSEGSDTAEAASGRHKYFTSIQLQEGDTLWGLAEIYMTEEYSTIESYIKEVKNINSLTNDDIHYGQYLTVPYYSDELK